ncbi:MAG: hypothetical protein AB1746_02840 [Candidatus Zixiibacteriota bacterium]
MRYRLFLTMLPVFILILSKCDVDTSSGSGGISQAGIYSFSYYPQADTSNYDCPLCNDRLTFQLSDDRNDSSYYWIGMFDKGKMVGYSKEFLLSRPFQDTVIFIDVNYTFNLNFDEPWDYEFTVFTCTNQHNIGYIDSATSMSEIITVPDLLYVYANDICNRECCTKIHSRYRAFFIKNISKITGASACIKTNYGKLCGQDYSSSPAQSNVYVGVQDTLCSQYLQIGYMIKRGFQGYPSIIDTFMYYECKGINIENEYLFIPLDHHDESDTFYIPLPDHGTNHTYECIANIDDGKIIFNFDGIVKPAFYALYWNDRPVPMAIWAAEIDGLESDMAGSEIDPCYITQCDYRDSNLTLQPAFFDSSSDNIGVTPIYYKDFKEWVIIADKIQNAIIIYDKDRLE